MYKIGIIGDRGTVAGFMALGYSVFEAESAHEAEIILKRLAGLSGNAEDGQTDKNKDEYAIIFITQNYAAELSAEIKKLSAAKLPSITVLPDISADGKLSYGMQKIKEHVEKAVGADILFRE